MNYRSVIRSAAVVLAGGLTLAGCQPSSSATNGAGTTGQTGVAQNTGTSASSTAASGTTATSAAAGTAATAPAGSGATRSSGGAGSAAVCQAGGLAISLSGQNEASGHEIQWIQLSNTTSTPCTMDGFAGVDLVGTAVGKSDYTWPLGRDNESYSKITLNPGEAAYFGIDYLPWAAGDGDKIDVTKIKLTPPNTTTTVTLSFSASVLLQDAATHPGTYLSPIALGRN